MLSYKETIKTLCLARRRYVSNMATLAKMAHMSSRTIVQIEKGNA